MGVAVRIIGVGGGQVVMRLLREAVESVVGIGNRTQRRYRIALIRPHVLKVKYLALKIFSITDHGAVVTIFERQHPS